MRRFAWWLVLGIGPTAGAQGGPHALANVPIIPTVVRSNPGLFATPNPLQPGPEAGGATPVKPDPAGREDGGKTFEILRSGEDVTQEGDVVSFRGGFEALYDGYRITGDAGEANLRTRVFRLTGNVRVIGKDSEVTGDDVTVDFKDRSYVAIRSRTELAPTVVGGRLSRPLFVSGERSSGTERRTITEDGCGTTCDHPEHPHYAIRGRSVDVIPGRRAIFRDAKFQILGRTVLGLPYFVVPLDDRQMAYLPEVGQSRDEGFYIKSRWGIPVRSRTDSLYARVDYMTKLGLGLGADYGYASRLAQGSARFYTLQGANDNLNFSVQHRQKLGTVDVSLDQDFQQNNYLNAPEATLVNTRLSVTVPQGRNSTRFGLNRNAYLSGSSATENRQVSLSDQRSYGRSTRTTVDVTYSSSEADFTGNSTLREQVDLRLRGTQELQKATALLEYQRSIPVGDTSNFFRGADRTPVFTLQSDSTRLMGKSFGEAWPIRMEASVGEFYDAISKGSLGRTYFQANLNRPSRGRGPFRLDWNAGFRQGLYSDDTAQYILENALAASYQFAPQSTVNLRYSYLRGYGYTPLSLDQAGTANLVTADVSYKPGPAWLVAAQTGYDMERLKIRQVAWQQVGVRTEYALGRTLLLRGSTSYDTFSQVWSNVRFDFSYRRGATFYSLGARYDGFRHTWGGLNLYIDNLKLGKTSVSTLLSFNGYTGRLDSQQYSLIYDLHCTEAVLSWVENATGFRSGREIQFFVRIKGLPFDSLFGTDRRGAPIGPSTGIGY